MEHARAQMESKTRRFNGFEVLVTGVEDQNTPAGVFGNIVASMAGVTCP